ncbi:aminomethyl-transferring glycine dehydrogenase subunit GcvPB [Candidatus Ichthyocystis hellenicum]|uniref:aminomethyl-transferring glycine dehydrogenase subunit GcvPB n=1 Tax=Candidatus Ichthyocystis hellenicum TaxID=1561003 RepID=UPI000B060C75|nr:aminomethyl-transferring glycine dehydrogenase subunit GcvPB [Candidatus Ichthyocystis hellenicum]
MLIFQRNKQQPNKNLLPRLFDQKTLIPDNLLRKTSIELPETSELGVVRHYTRLSRNNFCIDTHFYPLGSCSMKYNPKVCHTIAMLPGFVDKHPLDNSLTNQGLLSCMWSLQEMLIDITGMKTSCLSPMAGAQGELAGLLLIRAYHKDRGETDRCEIIVPDAAHGTNPATANFCGYKTKEIPTLKNGDIDLDALKRCLGPQTAGLMLTNPSTLGVFERKIEEINHLVHEVGALTYYDGANLNAILGRTRPGDMGFDVMHMNLHKTFATPHGGGGPGSGAIAVNCKLQPFIPIPVVMKDDSGLFFMSDYEHTPKTIGRLNGFSGNTGVLLRAYAYIRLLGHDGLKRVSAIATLNANYLMVRLEKAGFVIPFPRRRASHEFIISCADLKRDYGVTAMDVAKRLLDYGIHAPTTYFPLIVPECLLIEPTETESKETLDRFVEAMISIRREATENAEIVKSAPHNQPIKRPDEVSAAQKLLLTWRKLKLHLDT